MGGSGSPHISKRDPTPKPSVKDASSTTNVTAIVVAAALALLPILLHSLVPLALRVLGAVVGWVLRKKTQGRREHLLQLMDEDDQEYRRNAGEGEVEDEKKARASADAGAQWDGIVGFFHPFCNAGGGGERVLWAAIRATQERWPKARCVVYTGDHDASKSHILSQVKHRFNIDLYAPTITFLYLSTRHLVMAQTWPRFTLLGQSLGSMVLAWDALSLLVPDIFVDTMGYAFALGVVDLLFGSSVPTGAYVHYPTISTDMLESLDPRSSVGAQGVNAGQGVGLRGWAKGWYWSMFAGLYSRMGSSADVVMTNSTWTQMHMQKLWGARRDGRRQKHAIQVVYPPVAVTEMEAAIEVSEESERRRQKLILFIAQFRPEKNHQLIINAFSIFLKTAPAGVSSDARLVLVGSVRNDHDSKRVYRLRLLVNELGIRDRVEFHLDASWPEILDWSRRSYVGVNGMWNEHFGIGVVEYQAAGLISVVHDSGGPKLDIVTEVDGGITGFHASSAEEFAHGFEQALSLPDPLQVRQRARRSAKRFTEEEFARKWIVQMERLVAMK